MFDYDQNFKKINFRDSPELYRVGKGEQGVLLVEPYKSEILPHWKFRAPIDAKKSSQKILRIFRAYLKEKDFAGMDMARKFLQMGFTRSRRYANHRSGKKYNGNHVLPLDQDLVKAESARIFKSAWDLVEKNSTYAKMKEEWRIWYG